jgi:hypothetical protein
MSRAEVVPLQKGILRRAGGHYPMPLGALDAIHLATAQTWIETNNEDLLLLTHDRQLADCARACHVPVRFNA